jgi:hypothetical protein
VAGAQRRQQAGEEREVAEVVGPQLQLLSAIGAQSLI